MYKIPVKRELVYELKEKIYLNQFKEDETPEPILYYREHYGTNLPIIEKQNLNLSVIDPYTKERLDFFYKKKTRFYNINRVTRIMSKTAQYNSTQHLSDDFRICPANSKRNSGRQGSFINNVFEYGSFYHRLVPESIERWSKEKLTPYVELDSEGGLCR